MLTGKDFPLWPTHSCVFHIILNAHTPYMANYVYRRIQRYMIDQYRNGWTTYMTTNYCFENAFYRTSLFMQLDCNYPVTFNETKSCSH